MSLAAVRTSQGSVPATAQNPETVGRRWLAWTYVGTVTIAGTILLIRFWPTSIENPPLVLALLAASLILSTFKLRLPIGRNVSTLSMASAADLTALMAAGADIAMVTASTGVLLQCTIRVRKSQPLYRSAFSVASVAITAQAAGYVWRTIGGTLSTPATLLVPLTSTTVAYFLVNTALVATAIGLSSGVPPWRAWNREFFWSAPSYLLSGAAAGIVGLIVVNDAFVLLPLALIPLYISYRAYQLSLQRIDEERRHATQLAEMVAATQAALARATASEAALEAEKERLVLETSRLAVTVESIKDGVMMVGRDGSILLLNDEARRLLASAGRSTHERPVNTMMSRLGFPDEISTAALNRVWNGEPVRLVNEMQPSSDLPLVEVTGTPTRDADGNVAGAVWVLRDITAITRAEQERGKAAHLESLGVLAGGLAHDFNNILTGIVGNISLAQDLVPDGNPRLRRRLQQAGFACARARGVTNQLLTFAKGGAPVKTTASIRELVVECARFALSGSPVGVQFQIAEDLWAAEVDTNQIAQVVHNLVLNAVQAMPQGGVITITLDNVDCTREAVTGVELRAGRYVRLTVSDTGHGIAAEHLDSIFDPYFTTKERGSGLGLAISYSIVNAHGGAITATSTPGTGATFTVFVPSGTQTLPVVRPDVPLPASETRPLRVLLMDDDEMVAEVASEMLETLGHTAIVTPSGDKAVAAFVEAEQTGAPFDLVILDLTVPGGMGGAAALPLIRERRPDAVVFVTSGYAEDAILANFREYGFDGVLPKPFALPDLRRMLALAAA